MGMVSSGLRPSLSAAVTSTRVERAAGRNSMNNSTAAMRETRRCTASNSGLSVVFLAAATQSERI